MIDYFSGLVSSGDPAADVQHFYRVTGREEMLAHVTLVAAEARALAQRHGADVHAAHLAALAHDLAAVVPVTEMPAVAERMGVEVGAADRALPRLLHGPIAAAALTEKLALLDTGVLDAVRYHSTLRAGAGPLDKLAYDPSSPHGGEYLPALRAAGSLDEAVLVYLDFLLDNTWRYRWFLHPRAVAAYRELFGTVGR
jgi:HD superfamily phosphohydrolase YqeK